MYEVIASPFLDEHVVVRPGSQRAVKLGAARFRELLGAAAVPDAPCPSWLVDAARQQWGLNLSGRRLAGMALVREPSPYGYGRASYELNLGCNYDCEHCYLGLKRFEGMSWEDRERVVWIMHDAGVLWLQLTGGEATIDRLFPQVYTLAWDLGMMITVATNGSRLHNMAILELLTTRRPYRLTVSVYGATEESYDSLTRRRGSFTAFSQGLAAAREAELTPRPEPVEDDAVMLVEDVEELSAFNRCSCSASDDAPYQ